MNKHISFIIFKEKNNTNKQSNQDIKNIHTIINNQQKDNLHNKKQKQINERFMRSHLCDIYDIIVQKEYK